MCSCLIAGWGFAGVCWVVAAAGLAWKLVHVAHWAVAVIVLLTVVADFTAQMHMQ
jgi:hypothetical protein